MEWIRPNKLHSIFDEKKNKIFLSHPNLDIPFTIQTDASDSGIGAILTQNNNIIGLYSYKLSPSETNYTIVEKEVYAILKALHNFRTILFSAKIFIQTYNKNLINQTNISKRTQR